MQTQVQAYQNTHRLVMSDREVEAADINETAAQVTSIQLKQSLALESLGSITSLRSELVALLK